MADISKINLGGTVYNIKDSVARDAIVNTLKFKGITTVALTNEGTQVPTDIYGAKATTADIRVGDLVVHDKAEYVWIEKKSGEPSTKQWCLLDALNVYGKLASKNEARGETLSNGTHNHSVTVPTYTGATSNFTGKYTPAGTVILTAAADGVKISGTVSAPTIKLSGGSTSRLETATAKGVTGTGKAITSVEYTAPTHTVTKGKFVTGGTVSATTDGITIDKTTDAAVTSVSASMAEDVVKSATYQVDGECLVLSMGKSLINTSAPTRTFLTGASCANKFVTSVTHSLATADALTDATFTAGGVEVGTAVFAQGAADFTYATGQVAADGGGATVATALRSSATATAPTFTATTGLKATFTGTEGTVSVSGTPKLAAGTPSTISTTDAGDHRHNVTVK